MTTTVSPTLSYRETIAGFGAGVVGTIIGFPFDTVKTTMQTSSDRRTMFGTFKKIYQSEGVSRFYRGVASPLLALTILNTMNFTAYAAACRKLGISEGPGRSSFQPLVFLAGSAVGPIAALVSTPFELVKIQMQISKQFASSVLAARAIASENGFTSLYRGHSVNTSRECLFLGTYFMTYEHLRYTMASILPLSIAIPVSGGLAGSVGWFVSFPLDSIKANIQVIASIVNMLLTTNFIFIVLLG
jgi:hypothetical protein